MNKVILIFMFATLPLFSQLKATTSEGKIVILNNDGKWHYDTTATNAFSSNLDIPEKRVFNHPAFSNNMLDAYYFQKKYDKFKDYTTITFSIKLSQLDADLTFGALYIYKGQTVTTPLIIALQIMSKSGDWRYLHNSDLTFLVDGKRIEVGELKRDGRVSSGYVLEFLRKDLSINTFLEIVNASKVEAKLFTTEINFTDEQLEAMREFASSMK